MRRTSELWDAALTASHTVVCQVDAYLDGTLTLANLPILGGSVLFDDTAKLRRTLRFTVPERLPDGTNLDPGDDSAHPLAAYGQRLHLRLGIRYSTGVTELMDLGWYLITYWERRASDRTVTFTAVDLMQLVVDARLYHSDVPSSGDLYSRELTFLLGGILPLNIHPDVIDSLSDGNATWQRDRWQDIQDLVRAWGNRCYVDDGGALAVATPYGAVSAEWSVPVKTIVSGYPGTLIDRDRSGGRERLYNAVVVSGKAPVGTTGVAAPFGVAEITDGKSPIRVHGPYGSRPRFYQSDMLTSDDICKAVADSMLLSVSTVTRSETVAAVPDPSLETGDIVRVNSNGDSWIGRLVSMTLPLTATGGPMTVTVSNSPGDLPGT